MVHRDLKLQNILLSSNPSDPTDRLYIKVNFYVCLLCFEVCACAVWTLIVQTYFENAVFVPIQSTNYIVALTFVDYRLWSGYKERWCWI